MIFLGAGASQPFGIPTMQEMTTKVAERFPEWSKEIELVKEKVRELGFVSDLESILTVLSAQLDPSKAVKDVGPLASVWLRPPQPQPRSDLQPLVEGIRNYVRQTC